jgi:hypothetical protein
MIKYSHMFLDQTLDVQSIVSCSFSARRRAGFHLTCYLWFAGDAKSRKAGNLVMSDVAAELERHLAKKSKENGQDYQDLIVKHFKFDVFAA